VEGEVTAAGRSAATAAVGAAALLLYLATLSAHPSADSFTYAAIVESGDPRQLIDASHLLLQPLAAASAALWRLTDESARALRPLQALNALGGAMAVAALSWLAAALTGTLRVAALCGAGFAVSGGLWLLSTQAEFGTIPIAVNLLVLAAIVTAPAPRWSARRFQLGVGVAIGVAALTYLTNVLLLAVAAVAAARAERSQGGRVSRIATLVLGAAVPVVAAVVVVSIVFGVRWSAELGESASGYGGVGWFDVVHGGYAFVRSLLLYPGLGMNDRSVDYLAGASTAGRTVFGLYYGVAAVAAAVPIGLVVRRWPRLDVHLRDALGLIALWALLQVVFAICWVPGDLTFWTPALAAWWLVLGVLVSAAPAVRRAEMAVAAAVIVLAVLNALLFVLPQRDLQRNHRYWIADAVARNTAPEDVVVTRAKDMLVPYLSYVARRRVVPVAVATGETLNAVERPDAARVFVVGVAVDPADPRLRLAAWQAAGTPVWEVIQPPR
jgi:hypothetical protein